MILILPLRLLQHSCHGCPWAQVLAMEERVGWRKASICMCTLPLHVLFVCCLDLLQQFFLLKRFIFRTLLWTFFLMKTSNQFFSAGLDVVLWILRSVAGKEKRKLKILLCQMIGDSVLTPELLMWRADAPFWGDLWAWEAVFPNF